MNRLLRPVWLAVACLGLLSCSESEKRSGEGPGGDGAGPTEGEGEEGEGEPTECTDPGFGRCPVGTACNAGTGACELSGCPEACEDGQVCDPETRACVGGDPCREIGCPGGERCYVIPPADQTEDGPEAACIANCDADHQGGRVRCEAPRTCNPSNGVCDCGGNPCPGEVGTPCVEAEDCLASGPNPRCITSVFNDGYCASECGDSECPGGATCVSFGGDFLCMDRCGRHADCRETYSCLSLPRIFDDVCLEGKVCWPDRTPSTCDRGEDCAPLGSPCEDDDDCFEGGDCISQWPDGFCARFECDDQGNPCPDDGFCVSSTCYIECDQATKACREGYLCTTVSGDGRGVCVPRGCDADSDCVGDVIRDCDGSIIRRTPDRVCDLAYGSCDLPECDNDFTCGAPCVDMDAEEGCDFPGTWYGRLCDLGSGSCYSPCEDDIICGLHGYCDLASGRCQPRCDADADCPDGLSCRDGGCRGPCVSDDECAQDQHCDVEAGECLANCVVNEDCEGASVCDRQSGLCVRDLSSIPVGDQCDLDADCGSFGECLREANGFPGGYCSAQGCNEAEPCPRRTECMPIRMPGIDASVAVCLAVCLDQESCRLDYVCTDEVCITDAISFAPDGPGEEGEGEDGPGGDEEG